MIVRYAAGDNASIQSDTHGHHCTDHSQSHSEHPHCLWARLSLYLSSEDGGVLGEMAVFGTIGSIVVVAVFLWVWHGVFVRRVNKMLAGSQVSVATLPGRTGS
jgi:hypothetical protein